MIKAVLFDFGGVITSSCWDLDVMADIIIDTFNKANIKLPSEFKDVFKKVMVEAWNRVVKTKREEKMHLHIIEALERLNMQVNPRLVELAIENLKEAPFCYVRHEADTVLRHLRELQLKMCIVSNSPIRFHDKVLARHGLLKYFNGCIVVSCEVVFRKPDPRIFQIALEKLNVDPSEAIYVGDVPQIDIPGAKALGMKTVLMESPEPVVKDLPLPDEDPAFPDFVIRDLREIIDIVKSLRIGGETSW